MLISSLILLPQMLRCDEVVTAVVAASAGRNFFFFCNTCLDQCLNVYLEFGEYPWQCSCTENDPTFGIHILHFTVRIDMIFLFSNIMRLNLM